jgi:hypothetical protein
VSAQLPIIPTITTSIGLVRRQLGLFIVAAAVVELPVGLLALATAILADLEIDPSLTLGYAFVSLLATAWASFGHHALSALGERIVDAERGEEEPQLERVIAGFPWVRVIVADVLVTVAIAVGLLLLVVPGIVIMVWTAPMFPLLNMERRPIWPTLRRSVALTRGHFWRLAVLLAATRLIVAGLGLVGSAIFDALGTSDIAEVIIHFAVAAVLTPITAVVVVVATFDLRDLHDARTPAPS